jgi:hypothetical protein
MTKGKRGGKISPGWAKFRERYLSESQLPKKNSHRSQLSPMEPERSAGESGTVKSESDTRSLSKNSNSKNQLSNNLRQINRHHLSNALFNHGDAVDDFGGCHGAFVVSDDDELRVF